MRRDDLFSYIMIKNIVYFYQSSIKHGHSKKRGYMHLFPSLRMMIKRSRIIVSTNPLSISNPRHIYIIASSENHPNLLYNTIFKADCSSKYTTDNLSNLEGKNDFHYPGVTFFYLRHNHWKQIVQFYVPKQKSICEAHLHTNDNINHPPRV